MLEKRGRARCASSHDSVYDMESYDFPLPSQTSEAAPDNPTLIPSWLGTPAPCRCLQRSSRNPTPPALRAPTPRPTVSCYAMLMRALCCLRTSKESERGRAAALRTAAGAGRRGDDEEPEEERHRPWVAASVPGAGKLLPPTPTLPSSPRSPTGSPCQPSSAR